MGILIIRKLGNKNVYTKTMLKKLKQNKKKKEKGKRYEKKNKQERSHG